jgi:hypothetical protein
MFGTIVGVKNMRVPNMHDKKHQSGRKHRRDHHRHSASSSLVNKVKKGQDKEVVLGSQSSSSSVRIKNRDHRHHHY